MSQQQTWVITFNSDSDEVDYQANTLQQFLLRASSDIEVIQKPKSQYTQGGWVDLVITLVGAGGVTTIATHIIDAISTWIKSTHGASINIEIKEGHIIKAEAQNITSKDFERELAAIVKHLQDNSNGK